MHEKSWRTVICNKEAMGDYMIQKLKWTTLSLMLIKSIKCSYPFLKAVLQYSSISWLWVSFIENSFIENRK